ncbi:MAG: hypothetical protein A2161_00975 [Candidatus Schekmanbacteria bacterium RBG_13_48_7]|uniref:Uncharacterized protein n=1 Tax=Candidatus Schekmanbacteria bacterium RBG_13_48_7 TaxID=1817878 RepID=A0A1F7RWW4_9BACT|nr:MAG: hypothetical protein A2161_00975 [Candidatus Schekmanbacteria bacterium RBG_13_48_7]
MTPIFLHIEFAKKNYFTPGYIPKCLNKKIDILNKLSHFIDSEIEFKVTSTYSLPFEKLSDQCMIKHFAINTEASGVKMAITSATHSFDGFICDSLLWALKTIAKI